MADLGKTPAPHNCRACEEEEISSGTLLCRKCTAQYSITGEIPILLPSLQSYDATTQESFSLEWSLYRSKDGTWGITLENRIQWYVLDGLGINPKDLRGKVFLDAGCGNGSSCVGVARLGATVIGIDLGTGIWRWKEHLQKGDKYIDIHFAQADILHPPIADRSCDFIFSAGVLHHLPDTKAGFSALVPKIKSGGKYYVWLYRHEPFVTPLLEGIRVITTRIPPRIFYWISLAAAPFFMGLRVILNATGLREYGPTSWKAAALALIDIFASPYAHPHSPTEVKGWFEEKGFVDFGVVEIKRRGFGARAKMA